MKFFILFILLAGFQFRLDEKKLPEKRLFRSPSFDADSLTAFKKQVTFNDTIAGDTLCIYKTREGLVHSCSREINTGVCIDGECRRLRMTLFWTVTGRYYGFVLPEGEFLSKTEHVPFKDEDYRRLQEILANPYSALGAYRMDELISGEEAGIDGITAATLSAVKQESVPDAVYTTYTLWHLVYGETQKEIRKYTREYLTDELALQLLKSPDFEDKFWTLENMGPSLQWSDSLQDAILQFIMHEPGILSTQALSAFPDSLLEEPEVQLILTRGFSGMAYHNQRKTLERLTKVSSLNIRTAMEFSDHFYEMSPNVLDGVLKLYQVQQVQNDVIDQRIAQLLGHENLFIARKAVDYLETKNIKDKQVLRQIKKIKQKTN